MLAVPGCGGEDPFGIAVDGENVYWSNTVTGTVYEKAKTSIPDGGT
jgi:hypothetical protein